MSEFCDNCPLKGKTEGCLEGVIHTDYTYKPFLSGVEISGRMGVLIDKAGNMSEPILVPDKEAGRKGIFRAIEGCERPDTKLSTFRKREIVTGCHALGDLAITNHDVKEAMRVLARTELVGFVAVDAE